MPAKPYSYSYAVLRYVKDEKRDISVPVGVALWSADANWARTRMLLADEKVDAIRKTDDYPFVNLVSRKINAWIQEKQLPYQDQPLSPNSDLWWQHLRKILVHKVRISEPRPIDCTDPDSDLESLFKVLVAPESSTQTRVLMKSQSAQQSAQRASALDAMAGSGPVAQKAQAPFVNPTSGGSAYAAFSGYSG
jgi:hypothetical protein